jgi:hypothetical protein
MTASFTEGKFTIRRLPQAWFAQLDLIAFVLSPAPQTKPASLSVMPAKPFIYCLKER